MPGRSEGPARRPLAWGLFVVLVAVQVVGFYLVPGSSAPGVPYLDKVAHVGLFLAPSLLAVALRSPTALGLMVLHALVSEPVQALVGQGRSLDAGDTVADLVGCAIGAAWGWRVASTDGPRS